jgi:hypothetical protein
MKPKKEEDNVIQFPKEPIDKNWRFSLLNRHDPENWDDYKLAYETWKDCWYEVFHAIGKPHLAHSNAFTESDQVTALFYRDTCAALLLYKAVNFNEAIWREDSYFYPWPREALDLLTQKGPKILICSHYTVNKEFRKDGPYKIPFAVKDFIAGISFKYFLSTDSDAMTGNMRNAKGVQKSFYKWGAVPLMTDVPCNGETSDLVGVFKDKVNLNADPVIAPLITYVWEKWREKMRKGGKRAA